MPEQPTNLSADQIMLLRRLVEGELKLVDLGPSAAAQFMGLRELGFAEIIGGSEGRVVVRITDEGRRRASEEFTQ